MSTVFPQLTSEGYSITEPLISNNDIQNILATLSQVNLDAVGTRRLLEYDWCQTLAAQLQCHPKIASNFPSDACAVQCTYFEKSREQNWLVPLHQDLSIPVLERVDHPALSGWSEKEGKLFVQAPDDVLRQMVALRLHLDECGVDDGALKVVPGSHLQTRLSNSAAIALRDQRGEILCPVQAGGTMLMRPLLLHASSKANGNSKRRVLHFVFGPRELPFGLQWGDATFKDENESFL